MTAPRSSKSAFDAELVRALASLLDETGLSEIEYDTGAWRVRVARTPAAAAPAVVAVGPSMAAATPAPAAGEGGDGEPAVDPKHLLTSPMVGVVYTAPEPGAPPYVKTGDGVEAGATVLLIEAMKVFNPIKAHRSGTVTRILVASGAPVEYGEPLMVIE